MELISNAYSHIYKLNFIGIRFFSVYGPWGRPDMFYFKFLNNIRLKKYTKIYNYGNHHRSFTYIDDVISNIFRIIYKFKNSKKIICETFNIGDPNSTSLKKLIKTIEDATGMKSKKKFIKKHPADLKNTKANISREKKIFNHQINTSLKNGIQKLVNWYNFYYN